MPIVRRPVLEVDQRHYRAREREPDRGRSDPSCRAPTKDAPAKRDHDRADERYEHNQPRERGGDQPLSSLISSTSMGMRFRYIATIRPSPITTSAAATIITMRAKTWPSPVPVMRAKAASARLPPFSMSSRQMR